MADSRRLAPTSPATSPATRQPPKASCVPSSRSCRSRPSKSAPRSPAPTRAKLEGAEGAGMPVGQPRGICNAIAPLTARRSSRCTRTPGSRSRLGARRHRRHHHHQKDRRRQTNRRRRRHRKGRHHLPHRHRRNRERTAPDAHPAKKPTSEVMARLDSAKRNQRRTKTCCRPPRWRWSKSCCERPARPVVPSRLVAATFWPFACQTWRGCAC